MKELSVKTGIPKRTLDNYLREKGSMPPADYAVKIAKALNTNVEYLVGDTSADSTDLNMRKVINLYSKLNTEQQSFFLELMEGILKINT